MNAYPNKRRDTWRALLILVGALAIIGVIWTLLLKPQIVMVSNNLGSVIGGKEFIVSGKNFFVTGHTRVLVGGKEAEKVAVQSPGALIATAPPGSDGPAELTVISPNGQRAVLADGFTYSRVKPEITSATPANLPAAGGVVVTVKGTGFTAGPVEVHFHMSVIPATIIDNETLRFIAPPAPHAVPTNVNLEVTTADDSWSSDEYGLNYR